ncbi:hypothetical protein AKJ61_02125 [candidate division MSBL1 archaeon SCGC-AAA259B11]|uniref:ABC transporter domain-containing protein n=1 Tax=candidate division MSBL1 archaeon SCGC-AAA259B11 TaxID=1698260 RepID=A0A133U6J2_9EURY|nr:hypothetical protein AKJ61_02125 [candidate division MSBL1 archaeon SCGC-AAA259B11]
MSKLEVKGLVSGYEDIEILHSINLTIEEDINAMAITGPNGAGKSTLLKSIMGITDIYSGEINYKGNEITNKSPEEKTSLGIALMPQKSNVFPSLTVNKNLEASCTDENKLNELIKDVYETFPILREYENHRASNLSGGETQMLALGSAMMTDPKIMFLDEPCSGIQPSISSEIKQKVFSLENVIIVWIVAEDYKEIFENTDKCAVLSGGEKIFEGYSKKCIDQGIVEKALFGE